MPPDAKAYRYGIRGVSETAANLYQRDFLQLDRDRQEQVFSCVLHGSPRVCAWEHVDATRFYKDLLAETVTLFYSLPVAQQEIGFAGMADNFGWTHIGLNEREPWEPKEHDGTCNLNVTWGLCDVENQDAGASTNEIATFPSPEPMRRYARKGRTGSAEAAYSLLLRRQRTQVGAACA